MARVTGSHLIAKALKLEGVYNIFTLAGDHVLPVLDVMADEDFRFIDTRHEQAAVHMADAYGRITGQMGVCMYTTPGFANAIPGLTNAMHSESPLLSIAGSADLSELGRGAMQEIDQVGMAAATTKESLMIYDARRIPDTIARAVRLAFSGRRGPVHLTIPTDVQEQELDEDDVVFFNPDEYRASEAILAPQAQVEQAIALLRQAQRPFVIAGEAAGYTQDGQALMDFAETLKVPVLTEGQARGLVPDDHPYGFGFFERGLNRAASMLRNADVVVLLGRKQDYTIGFCRPPNVAADARIIQIDPSAAEIGRNRGVAVGMVGDVTSVVQQLTAEASKHTWQDLPWLEELRASAPPRPNGRRAWRYRKRPCTPCLFTRPWSLCCGPTTSCPSMVATTAISAGPCCRLRCRRNGATSPVWACWVPPCLPRWRRRWLTPTPGSSI